MLTVGTAVCFYTIISYLSGVSTKTTMANTQIIGRTADGQSVREFREQKLALKAQNYPVAQTRQFVAEYYEKIKGLVEDRIDSNSILVKVPSGSGQNKIVHMLANMISRKTGAVILDDGIVTKGHLIEAKLNLNLESRNVDPIRYSVDASDMRSAAVGKKCFVLDDLIGTGESSVKLKKAIERVGVPVQGLVNLVTVEKRYPTENDIMRTANKLMELSSAKPIERTAIEYNLRLVFGDYTRQKLNRFEREVRNPQSAIKHIAVLKRAAEIESKLTTIEKVSLSKANTKNISQCKSFAS